MVTNINADQTKDDLTCITIPPNKFYGDSYQWAIQFKEYNFDYAKKTELYKKTGLFVSSNKGGRSSYVTSYAFFNPSFEVIGEVKIRTLGGMKVYGYHEVLDWDHSSRDIVLELIPVHNNRSFDEANLYELIINLKEITQMDYSEILDLLTGVFLNDHCVELYGGGIVKLTDIQFSEYQEYWKKNRAHYGKFTFQQINETKKLDTGQCSRCGREDGIIHYSLMDLDQLIFGANVIPDGYILKSLSHLKEDHMRYIVIKKRGEEAVYYGDCITSDPSILPKVDNISFKSTDAIPFRSSTGAHKGQRSYIRKEWLTYPSININS